MDDRIREHLNRQFHIGSFTVSGVWLLYLLGMAVLGISCITNMAAGMVPQSTVSDDEVTVNAAQASGRFIRLMKAILGALEREDAACEK